MLFQYIISYITIKLFLERLPCCLVGVSIYPILLLNMTEEDKEQVKYRFNISYITIKPATRAAFFLAFICFNISYITIKRKLAEYIEHKIAEFQYILYYY